MRTKGFLIAITIILLSSMPAHARTNDERDTWTRAGREQLVKIVKIVKNVKRAITSLGDGLSDPKP